VSDIGAFLMFFAKFVLVYNFKYTILMEVGVDPEFNSYQAKFFTIYM
jgi:hypothetical protein